MSLDSSANLLFNIGANTDDAEANIARFRSLLGKDLDDLAGEFSDWAEEVVGEIGTVQAAMTAGVAVIAAAGVATVAALNEAANKYAEFVGEIARGSRMTGIAAEDMSVLKVAATFTGISFETLTHGIALFEVAVGKANAGSQQQMQSFKSLGISQEQLAAGEKDILPLLGQVMDRFHGLAKGAAQATAARELFGRSGIEMLTFLRLGSEGLKQLTEKAHEAGVVIGNDDVKAFDQFTAAAQEMKEHEEAVGLALGKATLPLKTWVTEVKLSAVEMLMAAASWKTFAYAIADPAGTLATFTHMVVDNMQHVRDEIKKTALLKEALDKGKDLVPPEKDAGVAEAKQEYAGLSSILQQVNDKMAAGQGEYEKAAAEITHLSVELAKARAEYTKLLSEGKLTAESAHSQAAALSALPAAILGMWTQLRAAIDTKRQEAAQKAKEESEAATADLVKRVQDQHEKTIEVQDADWTDEINRLTASYAKKGQLTDANEKLIADLKQQGLFKMHRQQLQAYSDELLSLQQHLASMLEANMNSEDKLKFQYETEMQALQHDMLEKLKLTKDGSQERLILLEQYGINANAIWRKQQTDMQALENSEGWQGIFGAKFGQAIRGDEDLYRQWAQSANQSLMMVHVTMEALQETAKKTFESMAQGMGSSIASALVYKKSIGAAMEAALASTLESLAGEAFTYAIYSTALGFLRLAQHDPAGASAAFTSAAIWGTVGAAAGLAGRALTPNQSSAGGGSSASANQLSAFGADNQNVPAPGQNRTNTTVNVYGHVIGPSGVAELTSMINDAVLNQDVTLTATNTKTGVQVTR